MSELAGFYTELWDLALMPILLWTIIAAPVLMYLHYAGRLHANLQYLARMALAAALPAGLFISLLLEIPAWLMPAEAGTVLNYKFLVIESPVAVSAGTELQGTSVLTSDFLITTAGMIASLVTLFLLAALIFNRMKISSLKKSILRFDINSVDGVSDENKKLGTLKKKSVQIGFIDKNIIPVTFGYFDPVILIPASLISDKTRLNMVLRHELMHIRKHDYLTHQVLLIIRSFFWFHPLIHIIVRQITDYREMRVDSLVLTDRSISKKQYATVLVDLLMSTAIHHKSPLTRGTVGMAVNSSNLKKRVDMMKKTNLRTVPAKEGIVIFTMLFLFLTGIMACTDLQQHNMLDEQEINMLADYDAEGIRGHHEITLFMSDPAMTEKNHDQLQQLKQIHPEDIQSLYVYKGENAIEKFGERARHGAITVILKSNSEGMKETFDTFGLKMPSESENKISASETDEDFFVVVEKMPELIGGLAELQSKIEYPEMARRAGIEGRVYVQFIVSETGDVENARVIRGIGGGADEEALRAVQTAKFKPGYQRGEPVRVQYSLPVVFKLSDGETAGSSGK